MRRFLAALVTFAALITVPALALTEEEMDAAAVECAREAITVCVSEDMTELETLTALHDWLALHCDYGATLRGETAYGALVEGTGNCVGYAEGYACLAAEAGLSGRCTYSEELDHAWILTELDGSTYFSDCTWDDGKNQKLGMIRHTYLLFDESSAVSVGHYGWDSVERVPGGVTRVIFDGAYAYYIDRGFRLCRCDRSTWATETLASSDARWPAEESGREELYTGLIMVRRRLYFNTPDAICYYDMDRDEVKTVLRLHTPDRFVYGIAEKNGTLRFSLAESAAALDYDLRDTGISLRGAWGY